MVTGGLGFIGSAVVDRALAGGWRVRVLDSVRDDVHPAHAADTRKPAVELMIGDVRDGRAVDAALDGADAVSHQAAKVGLGVDFGDAADYVDSNVTGTAVLLDGMRRAGVGRLVLASSMVVYGEGRYRDRHGEIAGAPRRVADLEAGRFDPVSPRTGEPLKPILVTEDAPLDPRNVYALSKLAQEHLVQVWARECGAAAAMLRYHNVYGPGMPQATPYAGVASIFRSDIEAGRPPRVFEDGGQRRDFVHVRDIAAANLAAIDWTGGAAGGAARAFNVGSGEPRTILDMARALGAAAGGPHPRVSGEYRLGDVRHITASSARIRHELGWMPRVSFDDGMREFARAGLRAPAGAAR